MKKREIFLSIFCASLGCAIGYGAQGLGAGSFRRPGAGMFPLLIGCGIIVLSFLHFIFQLFRSASEEGNVRLWPDGPGLKRLSLAFFSLIFYAFSLETLGFLICTAIWIFFLLKFVSRLGWIPSIIITISASVLVFLIFDVALKVPMPRSNLGFI